MDYWSDKMIEINEGPNIGAMDTFVCENCVEDVALANIVKKNITKENCSYCDSDGEEPILGAPFDIIMNRIYKTITTKYADAQDIDMPWVEGGWLTGEIYTIDVIGDFDPGWSSNFLDDVIDCLDPFTYWATHSKGDWSVVDPSSALNYGWDNFKNQVLTKTRYLVLNEPEDEFESG